ncbi:DMT family transporter [Sporolactobacillus laevolacticus]|uniref:Membrane protein n=1 Tax=Sporolactobacillus laevolacticus DSM 442 TaxID=1395513 RepID=V6IYB8_9BACL|nr:DMT family transporter [Sporolactobacillus laevolacticus]EST12417.1 membrane protein [Sporolactobacillus laevolacticus DSM 442]
MTINRKKYLFTSILLIWGLAAGMVSPVQTSINTQLRYAVRSPFIASLISFTTGTIILALLTLIIDHTMKMDWRIVPQAPKWIWVGGMMGVIFVTSNILLLPVLGSALTVVSVLCGQMTLAMAVDHFGWFGVQQHKLNWPRITGLTLMIIGIVLIQHF